MLLKFQKYEKHIMFGLVIITALAFGITGQMLSLFDGNTQGNMAGEIMGRQVSREEFQARRNQCAIWTQCWLAHAPLFAQYFGFKSDYKILSLLPVFDMVDAELYNKKKEEYLDELTWVVLMFGAQADRAGIKVSPGEVVEYIKNRLSVFSIQESKDSPVVFSRERYQWVLSNWGVSEVAFEDTVAEFIKIQKYREMVMAGIVPNAKDVYDEFLSRNGEIRIAWLAFSEDDYLKDARADDEEELLGYFQEHSAEYEVPQKVQIEYIMAETGKFREGLPDPNEDALQNDYNRNREKDYKSKAFPEAREEIRDKLLSGLARERALEVITKSEERITLLQLQDKEIDLKDIARQFNLKHQVTGFFALDGIDELEKELGASSLFQRQAATFQENELSRVISTDKGNFIFRLLKKQDVYVPKLTDQIKEKVTRDFLKYKANEAAKTAAHKLVLNIADKVNEEIKGKESDEAPAYEARRKWFSAFTKEGMQKNNPVTTAFFHKNDKLALRKGAGGDFKDAIFKMKKGEIDVVSDGDVYYVVQILDRRVPPAGAYDAEKERIMDSIGDKKKGEFAKRWLEEIRKQTNWKKYEDKKAGSPQGLPVQLDY